MMALSGLVSALRRPAFILCVLTLASSAVGLEVAARWLGLKFAKLPAPPQAPLRSLDRTKLGPYEFLDSGIIPPEMIEELGTEEYIHWVLLDTSVEPGDPTRMASLFVTYYTGQRDPVPHVPDVCYLGGGFQQVAASEETAQVPELEALGFSPTVPFRTLTFARAGDLNPVDTTVCYTFAANNTLLANREQVRLKLRKLTVTHSYFSKVEVKFFGRNERQPTREQAIAAAARLFRQVLPVLIEDHWPDWETLTAEKPSGGGKEPGPVARRT